MRRRLFVALTAATSVVGAFGTAAALPSVDDGARHDSSRAEWFGYEGVTVAPVGVGDVAGEHVAVLPVAGQTGAVMELVDDLGGASHREVDGILDVTAPASAIDTLELSPAVASVTPVPRAFETVAGTGERAGLGEQAGTGAAASVARDSLGTSGVSTWQQAGYGGSGTTVAVVDTGFAQWDRAQAAGQVPAVANGDDLDYCDLGFGGRPHGTATASVIHGVAPGARLVRVCIDDAMDLAAATTALLDRGDIDIVNMALGFYNTGPGDGSGGPGSPDDSVRRALAGGLVWVNSAGNEAPLHYRGPFVDADADGLTEFHSAAGAGDEYGRFVVPAGSDVEVFLRWNQWSAAAPSDVFRLCFTITDGGTLNCVDAAQPERSTPTTGVAFTNRRTEAVTFYVSIKRLRGTGSPQLDLFFTEAASWEHPVATASLVEPAAVDGIVAVGAACSDSGTVQPVSSQGPTADGRAGVSLVAPGVAVSGLFDPTADCQGGYGGTSAAAPHVSGALALLKQADPAARGSQLVDTLLGRTEEASDPGDPGVDPIYGHGMISLGTPPPFAPAAQSSELSFMVSSTSDRRDAAPLGEQVLSGGPFIWLSPLMPDPVPRRVEFYIDDTLMNVEVWPTLDLAGGFLEQSFPVDTTRWSNGRHRLVAAITWPDGQRELATANLVIDNGPGGAWSPAGALVGPDGAPLHRRAVAADASVSLQVAPSSTTPIHHVNFFIDAVQVGEDHAAPFRVELAGLALAPGQHSIRAIAINVDGSLWAVDANLVVAG